MNGGMDIIINRIPKAISIPAKALFTHAGKPIVYVAEHGRYNAVSVDVPQWLNWSETPITWSRADHPSRVESPGRVALVVRPKVKGFWLAKTLMDGGSSINIMYYDNYWRMGLPDSLMVPTLTTFLGIVPRKKAGASTASLRRI